MWEPRPCRTYCQETSSRKISKGSTKEVRKSPLKFSLAERDGVEAEGQKCAQVSDRCGQKHGDKVELEAFGNRKGLLGSGVPVGCGEIRPLMEGLSLLLPVSSVLANIC